MKSMMTDATDNAVRLQIPAAQRGPEWIEKYGCTPICVMDHTAADGEPGWHQGATITLPAPGQYASSLPNEESLPVLAARVTTVNDSPEIFGVYSRLWVDVDADSMELTVAETDALISGLEAFIPKLRVARAQLAEVAADDRPEDPEAVARWRVECDAQIRARLIELGEAPAEPVERHSLPCEFPAVSCMCPRPYIPSEDVMQRARRRGSVAAFFRGVHWFRVAKSAGARW